MGTVYDTPHAELYDELFVSRGKDFAQEAREVATHIQQRIGTPNSLLDVACGTGAHLVEWAREFEYVEGVELSEPMANMARRKGAAEITVDDMRTFDRGRTFDAVCCLGNSVACMSSVEDLKTAVSRMADHLADPGVLVVEPWWFPDSFIDGHVSGHVHRSEGRVISRLTRSVKVDGRTHHEVRFTVGDRQGFTDYVETLVVSLFTEEQYRAAFRECGLVATLVPSLDLDGRPNSPGLFIATWA